MVGIKKKRRAVLSVVAVITAIGVSGCALNGIGGGTMRSADGVASDRASFSISYHITNFNSSTGEGTGTLRGAYIDRHAPDGPVLLRFDGLTLGFGPDGFYDNCFKGTGNYVSISAAKPGTGKVSVTGCDNGRAGAPSTDSLSINVLTGPYAGYHNSGPVTGNLVAK